MTMQRPTMDPEALVPQGAAGIELRAVQDLLRRPRIRIEAAFLELGERLGDCVGMHGRFADALVTSLDAFRNDDFGKAAATLRRIVADAGAAADRMLERRRAVERLEEAIGTARRNMSDLEQAARVIDLMAAAARKTASSPRAETAPGGLATNLATLSDAAAAAARCIARTYGRLALDVRETLLRHARMEAAYRARLAEVKSRCNGRLHAAEAQRRHFIAAGEEMQLACDQLMGRVSTAVCALQVGDNARQRIEHVEASLEALCTLAEEADVGGPEAAATALALGAALQEAQLRGALETFRSETDGARRDMEALSGEAAAIIAQAAEAFGNPMTNAASSAAALLAELRAVSALLRERRPERSALDALAQAAAAALAESGGHLQALKDIERDMRILGDDGRSPEALPGRLAEMVGETGGAVRAAVAALEDLHAPAEAVALAATDAAALDDQDLQAAAEETAELMERLELRLGSALATMDEHAAGTARSIVHATDAFAARDAISSELGSALVALSGLVVRKEFGGRAADPALFARLRSSYTMEAQRRIHDELIPPPAEPSAPPLGAAPVPAEEDDWMMFD